MPKVAVRTKRWLTSIAAVTCLVLVGLWLHSHYRMLKIEIARRSIISSTAYRRSGLQIFSSGGGFSAGLDTRIRIFSSPAQLQRLRAEGKYEEGWTRLFFEGKYAVPRAPPPYPFPGIKGVWPLNEMGVWVEHVELGSPDDDHGTLWVVVAPYWLLVAIASAWPSVRLVAWWRMRRRGRAGHCRCGYDLAGCMSVCSECGRPVPAEDAPDSA